MIVTILERLFWVFFMLSTFNIVRHGYYAIQSLINSSDTTKQVEKYKLTVRSLFLLGLSLAYITMSLIKGINL